MVPEDFQVLVLVSSQLKEAVPALTPPTGRYQMHAWAEMTSQSKCHYLHFFFFFFWKENSAPAKESFSHKDAPGDLWPQDARLPHLHTHPWTSAADTLRPMTEVSGSTSWCPSCLCLPCRPVLTQEPPCTWTETWIRIHSLNLSGLLPQLSW